MLSSREASSSKLVLKNRGGNESSDVGVIEEFGESNPLKLKNKKELDDDNSFCNYIVKALVSKDHVIDFEHKFLPDVDETLSSRLGFQHSVVIPPGKGVFEAKGPNDTLEYVIIIYFRGLNNLRNWQLSEERNRWIEKAQRYNITIKDFIDDYVQCDTEKGQSVKYVNQNLTRLVLHNTGGAPNQILPPPKWKLYIIIDIGALFAVLSTAASGASTKMKALGFPGGSITFLNLCHIVFMIAYAVSPTLMSISFISKWLRAPRRKPQDMIPIWRILDQGFEIFSAPTKEGPPKEILSRLELLEGHVERLRKINFEFSQQIVSLTNLLENRHLYLSKSNIPSHPSVTSYYTNINNYIHNNIDDNNNNMDIQNDMKEKNDYVDPVRKAALAYASILAVPENTGNHPHNVNELDSKAVYDIESNSNHHHEFNQKIVPNQNINHNNNNHNNTNGHKHTVDFLSGYHPFNSAVTPGNIDESSNTSGIHAASLTRPSAESPLTIVVAHRVSVSVEGG